MDTPLVVNPFNYETPADRWSFTDREELLAEIEAILGQKRQRVLLHGRRRMGKTSLIRYAARKAGRAVGFVDLSTSTDMSEVAAKLLASVEVNEELGAKLLKLVRNSVAKISLRGGRFMLETELRPKKETFEEVLRFLDEYAATADQGLTLCFDEFQDIRRLNGERAEWQLRGAIQHHEYLNYVFSGSDHRLHAWMAASTESAFYRQLRSIEVGPIPPPLMAEWVNERARRGGLPTASFGATVVDQGGPCTGDIVRLAKQVFDYTHAGRPTRARSSAGEPGCDVVTRAFDAISRYDLGPEFVVIWRTLSLSQQRLLRAVAHGMSPFSAATFEKYHLTIGAVRTARTALYDKQILTLGNEGDRVLFDSPFFQRWVLVNSAAAP